MEILFKNSYVRNKQLAKEIYRYYFFQRKWLVVCYALLLLSFFSNILISIFEKTYNWGVLIFVPLFFVFQFYCYSRQVNTMIKRDYEVHGKEIFVETIVTNEYVQSTASTGAVNKLEYDKIKNAVQTKRMILLCSKADLIYIFQKDAFAKGNIESFIEFINSKGVRIK